MLPNGARLDAHIPSGSDPHTSLSYDPIVDRKCLHFSGLGPEAGMLGLGARPQGGRESGDLKSADFFRERAQTHRMKTVGRLRSHRLN